MEIHLRSFTTPDIEDESLGKNVVAQVFQSGYRRGDRILRHAMVQQAN